jgi:pullulanase
VPFFQAGQDALRSKSLDRNSYNSGDWFNKLDWTFQSNNWGVGLPPAENEDNWPVMEPLLANPALKPGQTEIISGVEHFQEMLQIRTSSKLFRLETAAAVSETLSYLNTGAAQIPSLIVMRLSDAGSGAADIDPLREQIVVLINANDEAVTFSDAALAGDKLRLHPVQAASADPLVRQATFNAANGSFTVPARTTVVFSDEKFKLHLPVIRR